VETRPGDGEEAYSITREERWHRNGGEVALGLTGEGDCDVTAVEYRKEGSTARSSVLASFVIKLLKLLIK
jgi:hypothetical protein